MVFQHEMHCAAVRVQWGGPKVKVDDGPGVHGNPVSHAVSGGYGIAKLSGRWLLTKVAVQPEEKG